MFLHRFPSSSLSLSLSLLVNQDLFSTSMVWGPLRMFLCSFPIFFSCFSFSPYLLTPTSFLANLCTTKAPAASGGIIYARQAENEYPQETVMVSRAPLKHNLVFPEKHGYHHPPSGHYHVSRPTVFAPACKYC